MSELLTLKEAARRLQDKIGFQVRPRDLIDRFYDGRLDDTHCRYVGGRRVVLDTQLDRIAVVLRRGYEVREERRA